MGNQLNKKLDNQLQLFEAYRKKNLLQKNLNKQLIEASKDGNLSQVKSLIIEGADIHAWDDIALNEAARGGHLEVVKYLVEDCDADVHAMDDFALVLAAWGGQLEIIKYLVEECGTDIHVWDDYVLRWAAHNGQLEVVKYLKTYNVSQFTNRHIDKQKRIEKSNQVFKQIRALPGIGIDYLYAFEHFNHLKTIY